MPANLTAPKKTALVTAAAAVAVLGVGALAAGALTAGSRFADPRTAAASSAVPDDRFAPGVRVAGIEVGGLTRGEAEEQVRAWARDELRRPVTFVAPRTRRRWNVALFDVGGRFAVDEALDEAWAVGRGEDNGGLTQLLAAVRGGARFDVAVTPAFHLDRSKLHKRLDEIGEKIRVPARNARARMQNDVLVVTRPERKGIRLDADKTAAALLYKGEESLRDGGKVVLAVAEETPKVTSDDLGAVSHQLASYSTSYGSSSRDRRHNVELAASHINGTLLAPGETFSYNDTVGPRSRRLGWREAPTYQNGEVVPGTGGGICQVSSTLYNAALLGNFKIVRRSHHSMPVHYVPAGRDATVAYGAIDFQFQNTTEGPVYIAARARGGRLTLALYGTQPQQQPEVRIVSGRRRPRRGGGFVVSTVREVVHPDGRVVREALSTDAYQPMVKKTATRDARPRRTRSSSGGGGNDSGDRSGSA